MAGNFSSCAFSVSLSKRHAPSSNEYSECKCKWTNSACDMGTIYFRFSWGRKQWLLTNKSKSVFAPSEWMPPLRPWNGAIEALRQARGQRVEVVQECRRPVGPEGNPVEKVGSSLDGHVVHERASYVKLELSAHARGRKPNG